MSASDDARTAGDDANAPLPKSIPGREPDTALDVSALDTIRARIVDDVEQTQGAWLRQPAWQRYAPLVASALACLGWAAWGIAHGDGLAPSALLAIVASAIAFAALTSAPRAPGRAEKLAWGALAAAAAAFAVECAFNATQPEVPGDDVKCASAICVGALLPIAFVALYLRLARAPARMLHVVAASFAGVLASMAAVWAECPGTALGHVVRAHVVIPAIAAVALVVVLRPVLRGSRASAPSRASTTS